MRADILISTVLFGMDNEFCRVTLKIGRNKMALRDPIGIWFSFLEDNWEECEFYYDFSLKKTKGIMQHTVLL